MAIGYSLRMCARHVNSINPGRSNLLFRSKPIAEAEMSNRLILSSVVLVDLTEFDEEAILTDFRPTFIQLGRCVKQAESVHLKRDDNCSSLAVEASTAPGLVGRRRGRPGAGVRRSP